MNHEVVDNFLPAEYFKDLFSLISGDSFPWYFGSHVADKSDIKDFYFIHTFYNHYIVGSNKFENLTLLLQILNPKALLRIRALQYIGRDKLTEHAKHADYPFLHKTCVLYLNTNDGFTRLQDGTCVKSVENRALFFDGSSLHNSTNCTSDRRRLVLTVNYF